MTLPAPGPAALHPAIEHHIVNTLGWSALRPLQEASIAPVLRGDDVLLLAPTAGGKTEAAMLPLLSRMATGRWSNLSVLYICPLRALLNNLEPRISAYAGWLGRRAAVWHGDTRASSRRDVLQDSVDILLTTPESLEGMLISTSVNPRELFGQLQAVVIDEVHAFADDDRGWHLLAVLERLTRLAGRPLQRLALSATIGNPHDLLRWLQGSNRDHRTATVIHPSTATAAPADLQLDYVGSIENAATVIASLHRGEKRLVFADSRRTVEAVAVRLRESGVDTFVSHSSLSRDERRRAEGAFSAARDCVIVTTSTLELGVDVGDLDRVIQIGAPRTVTSLLQRLGRTGRRPGTRRNALLLATSDDELLQAAALLRLATEGYVEPVEPPPAPRHVLAQQLLALCLQEGQVGDATWPEWLAGSWTGEPADRQATAAWLVETGHLDQDQGMLFIGPEAERRFGHRNFLELLSVFTAAPQFAVFWGRLELGEIDPMQLTRSVEGPRLLALGGRSWLVTHVVWRHRQVFVEPSEVAGTSRWFGLPQPLSFRLVDTMRRVVLDGHVDGVDLSRRGTTQLGAVREVHAMQVDTAATVLQSDARGRPRWWTWAGARGNALLTAVLNRTDPGVVETAGRLDNLFIRLSRHVDGGALRGALNEVIPGVERWQDGAPPVTNEALRELKFAELLSPKMALTTMWDRSIDVEAALTVAGRPIVYLGPCDAGTR